MKIWKKIREGLNNTVRTSGDTKHITENKAAQTMERFWLCTKSEWPAVVSKTL